MPRLRFQFAFPPWDESVPFVALIKAEVAPTYGPAGVVLRVATLRDEAHADAVAEGTAQPDTLYLRLMTPEQARVLGEDLINGHRLASAGPPLSG